MIIDLLVCICTRSAQFIEDKYRHVDNLDTSSHVDDISIKVWTLCCCSDAVDLITTCSEHTVKLCYDRLPYNGHSVNMDVFCGPN